MTLPYALWRRAVCHSKSINPTTKFLVIYISELTDVDGRDGLAGVEFLVEKLNLPLATVKRHLAPARGSGWVVQQQRGGRSLVDDKPGVASRYQLAFPDEFDQGAGRGDSQQPSQQPKNEP